MKTQKLRELAEAITKAEALSHTPEPVIYKRPPLIKSGSPLIRLGWKNEPPEVDIYVIAAENLHALEAQNAALSEQVAGLVGAVDIWQENPTTGNGFALIDAAAIAKAGSHERPEPERC